MFKTSSMAVRAALDALHTVANNLRSHEKSRDTPLFLLALTVVVFPLVFLWGLLPDG